MEAVIWGELLRGRAELACDVCSASRRVLGFMWVNTGPTDEKGFVLGNNYKHWFARPNQVRLVCGHPVEARIEF
jgi:hypothetical protein